MYFLTRPANCPTFWDFQCKNVGQSHILEIIVLTNSTLKTMQVSPETSAQHSVQHAVIKYSSSLELESLWKPRIFEISCSSMVYMHIILARCPTFWLWYVGRYFSMGATEWSCIHTYSNIPVNAAKLMICCLVLFAEWEQCFPQTSRQIRYGHIQRKWKQRTWGSVARG